MTKIRIMTGGGETLPPVFEKGENMTIRNVLDYVDELYENVFSENIKLRWLNQLEAEIQTEVLLLDAEGIVQYTSEDLAATMIAPPPFDKIYEDYLIWRIALAQGEAERANNQQAVYEESYLAYVRFVCETINPGDGQAEQLRYYLSAYQIAVKNGFTGTELEWLESLTGADGQPGAGLNIKGQVATENDLPTENVEAGDGWLVGSGSGALLYIWDGTEWFYKTQLAGKGDKGDKGEQGETGPEGVGIAEITFQEETEEGNVYVVTLTNGKQYLFTALKGPAGPIGETGAVGAGIRVEYEETAGRVTITNEKASGGGGTGEAGTGIESISFKAAQETGNVYTIHLTDGTDYDFTAPMGPAGADGQTGETGATGATGRGIHSVSYDQSTDTLTVHYDDDTNQEVAGFGGWMQETAYDPEGAVKDAGGISAYVASQTLTGDYIPTSEKGAKSGVATLGSDGKVPSGQLNLSNSTTSSSTTQIANSAAVKAVKDAIPSLSSSTSSTSTTTAADSNAVKTAYDKAVSAYNLASSAAVVTTYSANPSLISGKGTIQITAAIKIGNLVFLAGYVVRTEGTIYAQLYNIPQSSYNDSIVQQVSCINTDYNCDYVVFDAKNLTLEFTIGLTKTTYYFQFFYRV